MRRSRFPKVSPRPSSIGADFVGTDHSALILGDNIFYGPGFGRSWGSSQLEGANVFAYRVADPSATA